MTNHCKDCKFSKWVTTLKDHMTFSRYECGLIPYYYGGDGMQEYGGSLAVIRTHIVSGDCDGMRATGFLEVHPFFGCMMYEEKK